MGNKSSISQFLYCIKQDKENLHSLQNSDLNLDDLNGDCAVNLTPKQKFSTFVIKEFTKEENLVPRNSQTNLGHKYEEKCGVNINNHSTSSKLMLSSILDIRGGTSIKHSLTNSECMNDPFIQYSLSKCQPGNSIIERRIYQVSLLNKIKKLQLKIKNFLKRKSSFMHKYTYDCESKSSVNNVSLVLRDDKSMKCPPELYIHSNSNNNLMKDTKMSASNVELRSQKNHANSEYNNKSIRIKRSRYNVDDINSNSANISKNIGLSCKYFKMKYDNEQTKAIKRYIEKQKFKQLKDCVFGIKLYSNKSKIVGFFNSSGEADGLAVYHCSGTITYKGNILMIYN